MRAPAKYRSPHQFPTWYRHPTPIVKWPRGFPHPEDEPEVRCRTCGADLIDYDHEAAVEAQVPSCRDARRSW